MKKAISTGKKLEERMNDSEKNKRFNEIAAQDNIKIKEKRQ